MAGGFFFGREWSVMATMRMDNAPHAVLSWCWLQVFAPVGAILAAVQLLSGANGASRGLETWALLHNNMVLCHCHGEVMVVLTATYGNGFLVVGVNAIGVVVAITPDGTGLFYEHLLRLNADGVVADDVVALTNV